MSDARILVTGGSGFMGTNLVDLALTRGETVESWDVLPPRNPAHGALCRKVNVQDRIEVDRAMGNFAPTCVFHLAARTDLRGTTVDDYDVNVRGTENVLAAGDRASSVEHLLIASTRLVCRLGYSPRADDDYAPDSPYGESKARMEDLVRAAPLTTAWTLVRPTSIWGPWFGTPYRDFFLALAHGRYFHPAGEVVCKSFGYVGNAVHQLRELCNAERALVDRRTFYLADYEPIDVLDFANRVRSRLGRSPVRSIPMPALRSAAALGDVLRRVGMKEPPLTRFRLRNLTTPMVYDLEPLQSVVGPVPFTVDSGIELTLAWLEEQGLV